MSSLVIDKILETRKITEYLSEKGVNPDSETNGKLRYHCPLHEGDNTPSFYVYLNSGTYENFYCFGCKARYNIIHLYRDLEKVTLGQSIRALANGLEIDINAELSSAIAAVESDVSVAMEFSPAELSLLINRQLYEFLKMVDNDPACVAQVDKMSQVVDKALDKGDIETLKTINDSLTDTLAKRVGLYFEEKERRIMQAASQMLR